MSNRQMALILDRLGTAASLQGGVADGDLLTRYVSARDEAALATLVRRHGPMVLRVCGRVLGNAHDAEDAFQATFLVLLRQAASVRKQASLGSWLYGVAWRVARQARTRGAVRRDREREAVVTVPPPEPPDELAKSELRAALDEEVRRLPEKYRAAVVLCCVEGKTHEQAARELRWPKSSVTARLARARQLLQRRLTRRGFAVTAGLLAALFAEQAAAGAVSAGLILSAVRLAIQARTGRAAATTPAVALADRVVKVAALTRRMAALALVLVVGLAGAAATFLVPPGPEPTQGGSADPPPPAAPAGAAGAAGAAAPAPLAAPMIPRGLRGPPAPTVPLPKGALVWIGNARLRHNGYPYRVVYSPNGKLLASAGEDRLVRLWDPATGRELRQFAGHDGPVYSVAFSPDGCTLASGGDQTVRLWDVATGKEFRRYVGHTGLVLPVAFSPDGRTLASEAKDTTVRLWDVATGKEVLRLPGHKSDGTSNVAFSPDGTLLATVGEDRSIGLWDVKTGQRRGRLVGHGGDVESLAFFTDGKALVSGGLDKTVRVWDLATGKETRKITAPVGGVFGVAVSPDGKLLATGGHDRGVRVFDAATGDERWLLGWHGYVKSVAFAPDSKALAAVDSYGVVRLWDVATGLELPQSGELVTSIALSADGTLLVTGCRDHVVRLWDPRTGRLLRELKGHSASVTALAVAPGGKVLASAASEGGRPDGIRTWDLASGEPLPGKVSGWPGTLLGFSPDGKILADESRNEVRFWDAASGKLLHTVRCSWNGGRSAAFSPDGRLLAVVYEKTPRGILFCDVETGKVVRNFALPRTATTTLAFSPDGKTLALGDRVGGIYLLETASGKQRVCLGDPTVIAEEIAFTSNGRALAWLEQGSVRVTATATGKELRRFVGHQGEVKGMAVTDDGSLLASRGGADTAIVWTLAGLEQELRPSARIRSAEELDGLWQGLASEDAAKAYQAIWALADSPGQAVAMVRQRVTAAGPVHRADADRFAHLLAELDAGAFERRAKAADEMAKLGSAAEGLVRAELAKGSASVEVRVRLEQVLETIQKAPMTGELLRPLRGVEVLEQVGTAEARQVLAALAQGAAEARLTREAKATEARLEKRLGK
jgi:RNA polymerase sigma factor (sigma-70 family)